MWKRSCRRRCAKIEEKPDKEVKMEVMVAVGEGMENGDVRGIKMEVDEVRNECVLLNNLVEEKRELLVGCAHETSR